MGRTSPSCNNNPIGFAQAGKTVVGLYVGAQVHRQGIPSQVIDRVLGLFSASNPPAASFLVELCDPNAAYGADYMVGIAVNTGGDVHQVQQSVRQWTKGSCLAGASGVRVLGNNLTFLAPAPETTIPAHRARRLSRREEYCTNSKSVVGTFSLPPLRRWAWLTPFLKRATPACLSPRSDARFPSKSSTSTTQPSRTPASKGQSRLAKSSAATPAPYRPPTRSSRRPSPTAPTGRR